MTDIVEDPVPVEKMDEKKTESCKSASAETTASSPADALVPNNEEAGITHNCGVFGCIGAGEWPTQIDVAQIICLGLVALQHR